jgi:hypothetical protein
MYKFSATILLACVLVITGCVHHKNTTANQKLATVLSATSLNTLPGQAGNNGTTEYTFTLLASQDEIKIDSVLICNTKIKTISKKASTSKYFDMGKIQYQKGDTIVVRAATEIKYGQPVCGVRLLLKRNSIAESLKIDSIQLIKTH